MGQAAVDLPDPLEMTPTHAGAPEGAAAGADDLLAQMAGQEIDRLLADAEVEPEPAAGALTPAGVARALEAKTPQVEGGPPQADLTNQSPAGSPARPVDPDADLLPDVPGLEPADPGPASARSAGAGLEASTLPRANIPVGPNTSATEDAAVAELFDQLTGGIGSGIDGAGAAAPDSLAGAGDAVPAGATPPERDDPEAPADASRLEAVSSSTPIGERSYAAANPDVFEMTAAERAALEAPLPATDDLLDAPSPIDELPPEPAPADQTATPASEGEEPAPIFQYERVPFYVRMLEWVNAPFDALPDGARDAIGKVAVMTLVNAVAILIYVLFFRH
jgi:hypothetical protein